MVEKINIYLLLHGLIALVSLFSLWARTVMAQATEAEANIEVLAGEFDDLTLHTRAVLYGQNGFLGQALRIPNSLFTKSPCQLVYMASPDWATYNVQVDFSNVAAARQAGDGCQQQAFFTYIDGYNTPAEVTGVGYRHKVPWASIITTEAYNTVARQPPASERAPSSEQPPGAKRRALGLTMPLDRQRFTSKYHNLRDSISAITELFFGESTNMTLVPGPGSAVKRPVMASGYSQDVSAIPEDPEPYLEYIEQHGSGGAEGDEAAMSFLLYGNARIYTPTWRECIGILRRHQFIPVSGAEGINVSKPQDSCYVTQQVIMVFNNCTANSSGYVPSNPALKCASGKALHADGSGADRFSRQACLLQRALANVSMSLGYSEAEGHVLVHAVYTPYERCYKKSALRLGQAALQIIFWTALCFGLIFLVVLLPTLFRMFLEFPLRAIAHGWRKVRDRKKPRLPLRGSLHSLKKPWRVRCIRIPLVSHSLWLRKQFVYALSTVHSPDGQYRALQAAVTSSVALMICMVAYPPSQDPPLDHYVPPITFRIVRWGGDPLMSVWYLLQVLAYSLYLGFFGYLAMLANYNTPRNKYYTVQCVVSAFSQLVLNSLVLVHIVGILTYFKDLRPRWPFLPMCIFQLGNLAVANVLQVVTLSSREDINDRRRREQHNALMAEISKREAAAAARSKSRPAASSSGEVGGASVRGSAVTSAETPPPPPQEEGFVPTIAFNRPVGMPPRIDDSVTLGLPYNRRTRAYLSAESTDADIQELSRGGSTAGSAAPPSPSGFYNVCAEETNDAGGAATAAATAEAATGERGSSNGKGYESSPSTALASSLSSVSEATERRRAKEARWAAAKSLWKRLRAPLSEDAAFRFPSWFISALMVSAYMLIFMYTRALTWSKNVEDCISDPAECLNTAFGRYIIFASRLAAREAQIELRDTLVSISNSRTSIQAAVDAALSSNETTVSNVTAIVDAPNLANITDNVTATLQDQISTNVTAIVADVLGEEAAAMTINATVQARLSAALRDAVRSAVANLSAAVAPEILRSQRGLLQQVNSSIGPVFRVLNESTAMLNKTLDWQDQLQDWKIGLQQRFTACSVTGFTLGLLLGLSSLLQTAISFRRSCRRLLLARLSHRIFAASGILGDAAAKAAAEAGVDAEVDAGVGVGDSGHAWAQANFSTVYDDEDSIVHRSKAASITLVVFFFGVLLSTAIVQLYVVGIVLSTGLAVMSHPWLWTWFLPRYYMWLVAIAIGIVVNKVFLISFIGNTWLSDGDRVHRPAAWLAFLVIASATNLVIGLLLAVYRIVLLLVTTIFALGKLDVTIFTIMPTLDVPHRTFLAGLHLQEAMSRFYDPIYLPGPRGRAHRRWRRLQRVVRTVSAKELQKILYGEEGIVEVQSPEDENEGSCMQVELVVPASEKMEAENDAANTKTST